MKGSIGCPGLHAVYVIHGSTTFRKGLQQDHKRVYGVSDLEFYGALGFGPDVRAWPSKTEFLWQRSGDVVSVERSLKH